MRKFLRLGLIIFIPLLFFFSIFYTFTRMSPTLDEPDIDVPHSIGEERLTLPPLPKRANTEATSTSMKPPLRPAEQAADGGGNSAGGQATPAPTRPTPAPRRTIAPYLEGDEERAESVKRGFLLAWNSYKETAWGKDELRPISRTVNDWGGFGLTITDALDTAHIMGLKKEFKEGADWIVEHLNFDKTHTTSTFEIIIRVLGGLIGAYDLSGDERLLAKAADMGERLMAAFDSPSGLPWPSIDLHTRRGSMSSWLGGNVALSEVGTLQMEFIRLAALTKEPKYAKAATKVTKLLQDLPKPNNLTSIHVGFESARWAGSPRVTLGALGDSFYEYLIKTYLMTNNTAKRYIDMYSQTAHGILKYMIRKTEPSKLTILVELGNRDVPESGIMEKMDHLACFAAGMFSLGSRAATHVEEEFTVGEALAETCWQMYARMGTGIGPEIIKVDRSSKEDFYAPHDAHHYLLRPEAAEAWFYLWRLTGDEHWRTAAWKAWQAIEKHCRVKHGYSGIRDVTVPEGSQVEHDDLQQSFFLAETLKYLYLIFMPSDYVSFDDFVFNTEAHPLRVFTPEPWLAELL